MTCRTRILVFLYSLSILSLGIQGCKRSEMRPVSDDVLLSMGDSVLTVNDVVSRIPIGLSATDSAAIFHQIVSRWVQGMVLTEMARSKLPDYEEIEERVNDYRNRLIVMSYLTQMRRNVRQKVSEDSIRSFYNRHKKDMVSERPLVKGILLKVPETSGGLEEMRRCVFSASDEALDELESKWATDAVQYEYFNQIWVDWQSIAEQIPYRFFDPDAFVSSTKNFETSSGGSVYLLHISSYLPSGSELPYEFAAPRIKAIFEQANMSKYEQDLVESLVRKAISDEKLMAVGYDPIERRLKKGEKEKEKKNQSDEK